MSLMNQIATAMKNVEQYRIPVHTLFLNFDAEEALKKELQLPELQTPFLGMRLVLVASMDDHSTEMDKRRQADPNDKTLEPWLCVQADQHKFDILNPLASSYQYPPAPTEDRA